MIGRMTTREDNDGSYIELYDKNNINFADIWLKGGNINPKKCKRFLVISHTVVENLEQFVPVIRKKQYAKSLIDYVKYHTGIKCDCVEFYHSHEEEYDDEGKIVSSSMKKYKYKKRK